ncbi:MAG: hypothetical protein ACK482_12905, partial [Aphanizomenon sp.]
LSDFASSLLNSCSSFSVIGYLMVIAFLCLPATKICCNINLAMDIVSVRALLLKVLILVFTFI